MAKRVRADSIGETLKIVSADQITPPSNVPLDDEDMPFFANVIDEFARSEWTPHQLELAAMLAQKMRNLRDSIQAIRAEGEVLFNDKGTPMQNPRIVTIRMWDTSILSTRRSLALHARARTGDNRDKATRSRAAKGAELNDLDDDLLSGRH